MIWNNSLYGNYRTRTLDEIWTSAEEFLEDFQESGYNDMFGCENLKISDADVKSIYYLLYASYGNSSIAASDENRFKAKLFTIMTSEGPIFIRTKKVLDKLITLSEDDVVRGQRTVSNHALNPGETGYSTSSGTELDYINEQNTYDQKRNINTAYLDYIASLKDKTKEFVDKFKKLFLVFVNPEEPLWYIEGDN